MARRRFFADAVGGGQARIAGAAATHLTRALRAEAGQVYELAYGGQIYLARIASVAAHEIGFEVIEPLPPPPPRPRRELAVALFKFDRFEWMLEKATELGLDRLYPLATRRTDPRLIRAAVRRLPRWEAIARQAAEQSRRADWPTISTPQPLAAFLRPPPEGQRLLLSEEPGGAPLRPTPEPLLLLAGPEGGFAPEETAAARTAGFAPVSLGPRILRCETAVLCALARAEE